MQPPIRDNGLEKAADTDQHCRSEMSAIGPVAEVRVSPIVAQMRGIQWIRRLRGSIPYWRSIKACERANYQDAISHYDLYRARIDHERPSDRAFYGKLLILRGRCEEGYAVLQSLVADLEARPDAGQNALTAYVMAWCKMTLAGMSGDRSRDSQRNLALSKEPPVWLSKVLPIGE